MKLADKTQPHRNARAGRVSWVLLHPTIEATTRLETSETGSNKGNSCNNLNLKNKDEAARFYKSCLSYATFENMSLPSRGDLFRSTATILRLGN